MVACLADATLHALAEQALPEAERGAAVAHLASCSECRSLLAEVVRLRSSRAHPSPLREAADLSTGAQSADGHYQILSRLGRGGMAAVYLARDTRLGRHVALKLLDTLPDRGDAQAVERFRFEARATARLSHPHIVQIYDAGLWEGDGLQRPFLVLEYLEGETLAQPLSAGPLAQGECRRVGRAIAEALACAHEHHILHCDLTPRNVFLQGAARRVRVLDFGLSRLAPAPPAGMDALLSTALGGEADARALGGTPAYMAPEQWQRQPLTPATDVWALGMLLYEMFSGVRPFAAPAATDLLGLALRVSGPERAPPLRQRAPAVPVTVAAVVDACLSKEPAARPPLPAVLAVLAQEAAPRRPWAALLAPAGLVAAVGAAVLGSALVPRSPDAELLVTTPLGTYLRRAGVYQELCSAMQALAPQRVRCRVAVFAAPRAEALVVEVRPDRLVLRPGARAAPLFPVGELPLSGSREVAPLGAVLLGLAQVVAAQGGAPLRPLRLPDLRGGSDELLLLGAFVRYYHTGPAGTGGDPRSDEDLRAAQRVVLGCRAGGAPEWLCLLGDYMFAVRCPACSGAQEALLARLPSVSPRLRRTLALELAQRSCEAHPAAALRLLESARSGDVCADLAALGVSACTLAGLRAAGQAVPEWLTRLTERPLEELRGCDAVLLAPALGERGYWRLSQGRAREAAADYELAYQREPHPAFLLGRAESLLALGAGPQVLSVLNWEEAVKLMPSADLKLQALLLRLAVRGDDRDAAALTSLYDQQPLGFSAYQDESSAARFCSDPRPPALCAAYRVLRVARTAESSRRLGDLLGRLAGDHKDAALILPRRRLHP